MRNEKRMCRFLLLVLLFSLFAGGCDVLDKGESDYWVDVGTPATSGSAIDASGGAGTVGSGGSGGQGPGISLGSSGPLGVKVYRTGTADASFALDVPAATPDFGAEPLLVTADMTIPVYGADPADNNVHYFRIDDSTLYHKIDDATINAVTGIRVGSGATLTLGINSDRNGYGGYETAALLLQNDLEVLGTLRAAAFDDPSTQESGDSIDRAALAVDTSGGVFIRSSGIVSSAGESATTGRGGHGGAIRILLSPGGGTANEGILVNEGRLDASGGSTTDPNGDGGGSAAFSGDNYGLYLKADVRFVSAGTIRADGGSGGTGGHAGGPNGNQFSIGGSGTVQNTGPISLCGGTGSNGNGGNGGRLYLQAGESGGRYLHNSGAITTRGGDGTLNGGSGGGLDMNLNNVGDLLNSGDIDASGGDSTGTDDSVANTGGSGNWISLYTYGGKLISSGSLDAGGGDVANRNAGSSGGQGGYVNIESYPDSWGGGTPAGAMEISGNILVRGGAGPNGGYGGGVNARYYDSNGAGGIVLRGYSGLVSNGGRGVTYGGYGGYVYLEDGYSGGAPGSGGLLTEADISASGGDATDPGGYGGGGGEVYLSSSAFYPDYGDISADGGAGATPGSPGSTYIGSGGW